MATVAKHQCFLCQRVDQIPAYQVTVVIDPSDWRFAAVWTCPTCSHQQTTTMLPPVASTLMAGGAELVAGPVI